MRSTVYGAVASARGVSEGQTGDEPGVGPHVMRCPINRSLTTLDAPLTGRRERVVMSYHARVGPLDFVFAASGIATMPAIAGRPVHLLDTAPLLSVEEEGDIFLVLDHRGAKTSRPAYVELWRPVSATETPVQGLFILASAHRVDVAIAEQPATLARLAERLIR